MFPFMSVSYGTFRRLFRPLVVDRRFSCCCFGLTNDLTSRTTHAADLHLSKCLLTSPGSQNPTLIGDDATKRDEYVVFVLVLLVGSSSCRGFVFAYLKHRFDLILEIGFESELQPLI